MCPPQTNAASTTPGKSSATAQFTQGFVALLPLWAGAIPSGIAYGVAARGAGLSFAEIQLMSLIVFSAAAQLSAVSLIAAGSPALVVIGAAMALNVQLPLLGLTAGRRIHSSRIQRLVAAWFLTDGAFGVAAARGPLRLPVLLGAGVSMYAGWNLGTLLGATAGHALPDPHRLGIDFVVPLAFLAVLVPLVRTRTALLVAVVAGATTLLLTRLMPAGAAVLGAGIAGSIAGAHRTHSGAPSRSIPAAGNRPPEQTTGPPAGRSGSAGILPAIGGSPIDERDAGPEAVTRIARTEKSGT